MAARTFPDVVGTLDRGVRRLWGTFVVGATGAVTLADFRGFSIARTGVGAYRLTLDDAYPVSPAKYIGGTPAQNVTNPLMHLDWCCQDAGARVFRQLTITAIDLTTVPSRPRIDIIFDSAANTPGELNTGSIIRFALDLHNSSTPTLGT